MFLLHVDHISKSFQDTIALEDVSLKLLPNKIYGLLGPNGAGKTTLIRNILQIFYPDKGSIFYSGEQLNYSHQNKMGYMPEERGMYKQMKVGEHLLYLARLRGFSEQEANLKINYWLQRFEIEGWRNKAIEELSKGMQQKVQFIATILHDPELLILDEPFSGLDPVNAEIIKNEIFELQKKGVTIIFSTHRMENVEEICEDIFLINKGRIVLEGNVKAIKQQYKKNLIRVDIGSGVAINEAIRAKTDIVEEQQGYILFKLKDAQHANDILRLLLQEQVEIVAMKEVLPSIQEIFIHTVNPKHE